MIGVVIATHGRLAEEALACAEGIVGVLQRARAVSVSSALPLDAAREAIAAAIRDVEDGDGVLVLTDMLGGTPANLALGFRDDERDYAVAAHMLMSLKIQSVRLMTNNPKKINQLTQYGIKVNGRIPHIMEPNQYNRFYLETKAAKSGHMIDFSGREHFTEQSDRPIVEGMRSEDIEAFSD